MLGAGVCLCLAARTAGAQSAPDRGARLVIDGNTADWQAVEAVFRNAPVCPALQPPCGPDEERADDSAASALQDIAQLRVTWDADALYVAAQGTLGGQALLVCLDWAPGGLASAAGPLGEWRRALQFGPEIQPEAFLAVRDAQAIPELWQVTGTEQAVRVPPERFVSAASFAAAFPGRALEASIPWSVLFPDAPRALDPEPGAPPAPLFVLPPESSSHGLRIAAVVVGAEPGSGALDVAPDNSGGIALDWRRPATVDRAAFVAWDANRTGPPHFVDFGIAIQTQTAGRFVPAAPQGAHDVQLFNLRTFANGAPSRLLVPDAGFDLAFAFEVGDPPPAALYLTGELHSLHGERVRTLFRDVLRSPGTTSPTSGRFGDPSADRWDGRDDAGDPVPAGVYVLRVRGGLSPGGTTSELRRAVTVVR